MVEEKESFLELGEIKKLSNFINSIDFKNKVTKKGTLESVWLRNVEFFNKLSNYYTEQANTSSLSLSEAAKALSYTSSDQKIPPPIPPRARKPQLPAKPAPKRPPPPLPTNEGTVSNTPIKPVPPPLPPRVKKVQAPLDAVQTWPPPPPPLLSNNTAVSAKPIKKGPPPLPPGVGKAPASPKATQQWPPPPPPLPSNNTAASAKPIKKGPPPLPPGIGKAPASPKATQQWPPPPRPLPSNNTAAFAKPIKKGPSPLPPGIGKAPTSPKATQQWPPPPPPLPSNEQQVTSQQLKPVGFLKRHPKKIKTKDLHDGGFLLSMRSRSEIERQIKSGKRGKFKITEQDSFNKAKEFEIYINQDGDAFTLGPILGKGTFGEVYVAQNAITGKWHCMKLLQKGTLEDAELDLLAQEGLCRSSESTSDNDLFIGELIQGENLKQIIDENRANKKLSFEQVLALNISLIEAYESLQRKGYVHRDIKPANVMVDLDQQKCIAIALGLLKKSMMPMLKWQEVLSICH